MLSQISSKSLCQPEIFRILALSRALLPPRVSLKIYSNLSLLPTTKEARGHHLGANDSDQKATLQHHSHSPCFLAAIFIFEITGSRLEGVTGENRCREDGRGGTVDGSQSSQGSQTGPWSPFCHGSSRHWTLAMPASTHVWGPDLQPLGAVLWWGDHPAPEPDPPLWPLLHLLALLPALLPWVLGLSESGCCEV